MKPIQQDTDNIDHHYGNHALKQKILQALAEAGLDLKKLKAADLIRIDQLHMGGHQATLNLANSVGISPDMQVLDIGCGLGGTPRLLATEYGCHVTGVDITQSFCESAEELTRLVGLTDQVTTLHANALDVPAADGSFDLIWCQHTQMNIRDKPGLIDEFSRLLKKGGKLAMHEVFAGNGPPPLYPVPWASEAMSSHLVAQDVMLEQLETSGFGLLHHQDISEQASQWWEKLAAGMKKPTNKRLGPKLIFGDKSQKFGPNVVQNLQQGSIEVHELILEYRG